MQKIEEKKKIERELLEQSMKALYENVSEKHSIEDVDDTGQITRKITLEGKWWKEAALPILVRNKDGEEMMLFPDSTGYYAKKVNGKYKRISKEEAAQIEPDAFCFYRSLPPEKLNFLQFLKFLLEQIPKKTFIMIFVVSVLMEFCGLLMPYINSLVYNLVIPSGTARQIPGIIIMVLSSVIFTSLIGLSRNMSITRIGEKMQVDGQSAIFGRLFTLPVSFFKKYDSGEIFSRADSVTQICQIVGGELIPAILGTLLSVVYIFQLSWFADSLMKPSLIIVGLLMLHVIITGVLQIKLNKKTIEVGSKSNGVLFQLIGGITQIRTAGAEVRAYGKWADVWKNMPVMPDIVLRNASVVGVMLPFAGSIALYRIAWQNQLSASDFIAFSTAFGSFQAAILTLSAVGFQFGALKVYVDMIKPILAEEPEVYSEGEQVESLEGRIELNNVYFRYRKDLPYVINGLDLSIKAGEYIGVVGGSGCGKSTLFRLLLGFETAESGSVYYDGKDIDGMDLSSLRRRIGVVLQNGSLFSGDIYTNLSICAPKLTMEEAWDAVERAGLKEDIEKMPMGMFTMLSEDGNGISGGQKQRLLIARALASDPDILLFDEATSALDNKTQSIVVKSLKKLSCTRLVIAHRLSTIMDCDRIIYLEKGSVVEEGSYEELMAKNGKFAEMARRQLTE